MYVNKNSSKSSSNGLYGARYELAKRKAEEAQNSSEDTSSDSSKTTSKPINMTSSPYDMLGMLFAANGDTAAQSEYASQVLSSGKFKGALKGKEELIKQIANKYGIEPKFFAAVLALESGWGASDMALQHNNFGGVTGKGDAGKNGDFAAFSSVEKGIEAAAKNLAQYSERYSDVSAEDIANVNAIGKHYCVGGNWASKVTNIYNQLA